MSTKYASYTEETIWGIGETGDEAREDGREAMLENDVPESEIALLKVAPIDEDLLEALEEADESGEEIMFDLIDGLLCEVEPADDDEAEQNQVA